jgi:hypothetical protein
MQHVADRLSLPDAEAALRFVSEFYASDRFNPEVAAAARTLRGCYKVALLTNSPIIGIASDLHATAR